jgi:hypothetical protein
VSVRFQSRETSRECLALDLGQSHILSALEPPLPCSILFRYTGPRSFTARCIIIIVTTVSSSPPERDTSSSRCRVANIYHVAATVSRRAVPVYCSEFLSKTTPQQFLTLGSCSTVQLSRVPSCHPYLAPAIGLVPHFSELGNQVFPSIFGEL